VDGGNREQVGSVDDRRRPDVASWSGRGVDGDDYDRTYEARAAAGEDVHGEANFVMRFEPGSVLDAGCGTGRIARELARRGVATVGVDRDPGMLATGQRKAPELDWRLGDLATVELGRTFEVVLLAGNVMLFVDRGTEGAVLANMARHLEPGGRLIAGFQLGMRGPTLDSYDALARDAGLELEERWATWDGEPWRPGGGYAVSVHRRA
jgi:SAM-dependent methyltransferase